jgi:putative ABC transport system permease protein
MKLWQSSTLWKYTLSEMRRRPGRTVLTLLGIVLGVTAVVSISLTTATTRNAYSRMFESLAGRAALEVVAEGLGGFDEKLATEVRSVPGVKAAVGIIQTPTVLFGLASREASAPGGGVSALILGVDPASDAAVRDYRLQQGRGIKDGNELLLEVGFARAQQLELGSSVRLLTPVRSVSGPSIAELRIVGLLEPRGAAAFNGGAVVFMPLSTAQRLFNLKGRVNSLQIVLADGADQQSVESQIRDLLPPGLTVQVPATRGEIAQDSLASTEIGLGSLSIVSLVAGAFVILNSFLMSLGERRRQFAILRALGATRRLVTHLLLREALLFGVAGTLLGCLGGWALSRALHQVMRQLLRVAIPDPEISLAPFLFGLVLGPGMALIATYWPARRAGRRVVLEDLLQKREVSGEARRRWPAYLGLGLVAVMLALEAALISEWFTPAMNRSLLAPGLAVGLVGCVLAIPLVLRPLMHLTAIILKPLLGLEGRIALRQLERQPTRTALTVGVLFIAVVVSIGFGLSLRNNIGDIYRWCDQNVGYDFMVRGIMPDTTTIMTAAAIPEDLADQFTAMNGVERVTKIRFVPARIQGCQVIAIPLSLSRNSPLPLSVHADKDEIASHFRQGEVILGSALAQRLSVGDGGSVRIESRNGPRSLRIAGTTTEYTVGGMVVYMDWEKGKELFDFRGAHVLAIAARKEATPSLAGSLQSFCDKNGLRLQSNAEFRKAVDEAMGGVVGFFWMLVVLVFVVASLGVVNTLTMNVWEQTRTVGILRAVAMTRSQVRKMILGQALALGVISMVPGAGLGIGLAFLMNLATKAVLGHRVQFHIDIPFVSACFVMALLIAMLAAFFPARRAARLQVIEALQYE